MTYRVEFTPRAKRELGALPLDVRRRCDARILALSDNPRPPGCEKLAGYADRYRVRVGDYRILYDVTDRVLVVTVARVAQRREAYRR